MNSSIDGNLLSTANNLIFVLEELVVLTEGCYSEVDVSAVTSSRFRFV